ncbi:MAG: hypothetical protein ACR2RL_12235, partial [Gammaproteobacteria bacterium]
LLHPVETNELFVALNESAHRQIADAGYSFYQGPAYGANATRMVTSWATRQDDIEALLGVLRSGD